MSGLLLGVDGGGTKTVALLARDDGTIVGWGRDGSSEIHVAADPTAAIARIAAAVHKAAAMASLSTTSISAAVFSLSGADWPEDFELYADELMRSLELPERPLIANDALGALWSGTDDGRGVALTLGTGGAVGAVGPAGMWFSGFRIEPSGALAFGWDALNALIRAEFAGGEVPAFRTAVLAEFAVADVDELLWSITRRGGLGDAGVGRVAARCVEAAEQGDPLAAAIVDRHVRMLAAYVRGAADRVGLTDEPITLVVTGGVVRQASDGLSTRFRDALGSFDVVVPTHEPVVGSLRWAASLRGRALDDDVIAVSGPPATFYETR